ncbi:hypothetical protein CLU79DRAFT_229959 [Phycomyces nitens]|nr:hypothetical protein CLU79DRAFT_229959 [Phycomyces nitens]
MKETTKAVKPTARKPRKPTEKTASSKKNAAGNPIKAEAAVGAQGSSKTANVKDDSKKSRFVQPTVFSMFKRQAKNPDPTDTQVPKEEKPPVACEPEAPKAPKVEPIDEDEEPVKKKTTRKRKIEIDDDDFKDTAEDQINVDKELAKPIKPGKRTKKTDKDNYEDDEEEEIIQPPKPRGRSKAKAAQKDDEDNYKEEEIEDPKPKPRGRAKSKAAQKDDEDDYEEEEEEEIEDPKPKPKGRAKAKAHQREEDDDVDKDFVSPKKAKIDTNAEEKPKAPSKKAG